MRGWVVAVGWLFSEDGADFEAVEFPFAGVVAEEGDEFSGLVDAVAVFEGSGEVSGKGDSGFICGGEVDFGVVEIE